jgi:2-polyprenyl-3-methyl-5-hydroxy-6-metoxy-1,4-benzoquinol methylase
LAQDLRWKAWYLPIAMIDLSARASGEEIMDNLECSGPVVDQTLRELETINTLLGGNYVTLNGLDQLLNNGQATRKFTIADLGCGGGDLLRLMASWANRKELIVDLLGVDANPNIIRFAKKATTENNIRYEAINIFDSAFANRKFDVVVATLFFHHFNSEQLVSFFKQLKKQVSIGIVINDLHRHWLVYYSIKILTRLFSKSAMVKFDAPLSVARSFRKKDWIEILEKAGIQNYTLRWMWAFRWQVVIRVDQKS